MAPDWHRIGTDWLGLLQIGQDWQIGEFESERKIDPRLAQDWHWIGRLAWIGTDGHGLVNWRICVGKKNWPPIGTGLAWIDMDWHGLARIGMDWQGLANWRICVKTKNWPLIGTGLA